MRISGHALSRLWERGDAHLDMDEELTGATPFGVPNQARRFLRLPCGLIAVVRSNGISDEVVATVLTRSQAVKNMRRLVMERRDLERAEKRQGANSKAKGRKF